MTFLPHVPFDCLKSDVVLDTFTALLEADLALGLKPPILLLARVVLVHTFNLGQLAEVLLLIAIRTAEEAFARQLPALRLFDLHSLKNCLELLNFLLLRDDELLLDGKQVPVAFNFMLGGLLCSCHAPHLSIPILQLAYRTAQLLLVGRELLEDAAEFGSIDRQFFLPRQGKRPMSRSDAIYGLSSPQFRLPFQLEH
jgi:hypothetical protein